MLPSSGLRPVRRAVKDVTHLAKFWTIVCLFKLQNERLLWCMESFGLWCSSVLVSLHPTLDWGVDSWTRAARYTWSECYSSVEQTSWFQHRSCELFSRRCACSARNFPSRNKLWVFLPSGACVRTSLSERLLSSTQWQLASSWKCEGATSWQLHGFRSCPTPAWTMTGKRWCRWDQRGRRFWSLSDLRGALPTGRCY